MLPFILDKPNSDKPTYILIKKNLSDGAFKYSLKRKILPAYWDSKTKRARPETKDRAIIKECNRLNGLLDSIDALYESLPKGIKKTELAWELNNLLGLPNAVKIENDFFSVIEGIIKDRKEGRELTKKGHIYSHETTRTYDHTIDNLKKFEQAKGIKLTFDLTEDEYNLLLAYFNEIDLGINTIGKIATHLRTFLKAAAVKGHKIPILEKKVIKRLQEDAYDIYLTKDKIEQIYKTEVPEGYWQLSRDWFVVGCFTGLRVSDLTILTKDKIIKDRIAVANEKTNVRVVIPLHWSVREILDKYGDFPPPIPDQKLNEYIKLVAKKAKLEDKVFYSQTKGGVRVDYIKYEWEMISAHTGRRSFITNLLKDGFPQNIVMKLAGIVDHRTLSKYDKISHEEVADIVSKHSSFSGKSQE